MRATLLLTLALSGCFDTTQGRDRDGDGFQTAELDGDDCDDTNININPDAAEVCGNGVDDNCDGIVDDTGAGDVEWFVDLDEDGFAGPESMRGCERPDGAFEDLSAGTDCDDADPAVNPAATEIWYDGVDQDCSGGSDDDADGDGFLAVIRGGDDCDDGRADVNPGMEEVCNNGLDDDCSFDPSECEYRGEVVLGDIATIQLAGGDYAATDDWNGDGLDDLWVGSSDEGVGSLFVAPFVQPSPTLTAIFPDGAECADNEVNGEVDYNGDGIGDLSMNCNEEGVFVFYGPIEAGSYLRSQADFVMTGSNLPTGIDGQLVALNDRNGDGIDEVLVALQEGYRLVLSPHGTDRILVDEPLVTGGLARLPARIPLGFRGDFPAVDTDDGAVVARLVNSLGEYEWTTSAALPEAFDPLPSWSVPTAEWDLTDDQQSDWVWPGSASSPLALSQPNAVGAPSVQMSALGTHPDGEIYSFSEAPLLCDVNRDGEADLLARTARRTGLSGFTFSGIEIYYGPGLLDGGEQAPDTWIAISDGQQVLCGDMGIVLSGTSTSVLVPSRGL